MGEVGFRVPLYSCAPGKAILAFLPDEELQSWLGSVKLKKFTSTTRSSKKTLLGDLAEIREREYAIDLAEGLEGIHCVGAPIFNAYGYPVAAITVMAPIFRLPPENFDQYGEACLRAAQEIQDRLLA